MACLFSLRAERAHPYSWKCIEQGLINDETLLLLCAISLSSFERSRHGERATLNKQLAAAEESEFFSLWINASRKLIVSTHSDDGSMPTRSHHLISLGVDAYVCCCACPTNKMRIHTPTNIRDSSLFRPREFVHFWYKSVIKFSVLF